MPNWTTNVIRCQKENLKYFVNYDGNVDFNLIRPMPEDLNVVSGSEARYALWRYLTEDGKKEFPWPSEQDAAFFAEKEPDDTVRDYGITDKPWMATQLEYGERLCKNLEKYGAKDWYDWCVEHWGTKWNACDTAIVECEDGTVVVRFCTAWSQPEPEMMDELFKKFSGKHRFECAYEDFDGTFYDEHGRAVDESEFFEVVEDDDGYLSFVPSF